MSSKAAMLALEALLDTELAGEGKPAFSWLKTFALCLISAVISAGITIPIVLNWVIAVM